MAENRSPMEIYKLLQGSNCRECSEPTCLAFAAAVFKGQKRIDQCPYVDDQIVEQFGGEMKVDNTAEIEIEKKFKELKNRIQTIDLPSIAEKLGGRFEDNKLKLKVLGKDFCIDANGNLSSEIHIHRWITMPFLDYIVNGAGKSPTGRWVSLRELPNGKTWENFFNHRAEIPLKKIADNYTELFRDMIHVFNGKKVERMLESDISLVLLPLPKFPILINYWEPGDGLGSSLNIFFDDTAEDNLSIESIYSLGTGIAVMFEKIAQRHGVRVE
jgi:hypothetical protein